MDVLPHAMLDTPDLFVSRAAKLRVHCVIITTSLTVLAVACDDTVRSGSGGSGGEARSSGVAGAAGHGGTDNESGACNNQANSEFLAGFTYSLRGDGDYDGALGVELASNDCLFGNFREPVPVGCASETIAVIEDDTDDNRATLTTCVESCMAEISIELTPACLGCYVTQAVCRGTYCAPECATEMCNVCLCIEGCPAEFEVCSGLPTTADCDDF